MLNGLPEAPVSHRKACELRDRNVALAHRAVVEGAPNIAGDSARNAVHWARYARALEPLDEVLSRLARAAAAMTLPVACDWAAKEVREADPLDQGLARLTRAEVEAAVAVPEEYGIEVEETGFEVIG
jgi:hypothetical protein